MACFIVPAAEAVVTTAAAKVIEKKGNGVEYKGKGIVKKMKWLNNMLWGGSALLLFEHIWHGEVIPSFPFLTGALSAADRAEMFGEMATAGVGMAVLVTAVWGIMVGCSYIIEKRDIKSCKADGEG